MTEAAAVALQFALAGPVTSIERHPSGHINDAWLVVAGGQRSLLQRLNPAVFADPDAVMDNMLAVTVHLRVQDEATLTLVATRDGAASLRDDEGAVWRMYDYVEDVHPAEVRSPADAAVVGRAFGRFHRLVATLDPALLRVSIPGFHDPARRLAALQAAVVEDRHDRAGAVADDVDALVGMRPLVDAGRGLASLPVRVAHNDAKAANLLVDDTGRRPPLVVDLDTMMPGSLLWDVGDMVRSSTGAPEEDGGAPRFDADRYDALVHAYLEETADLLSTAERDAIDIAGPVVTYEQAVRFLTDHVLGDVYFRIDRPDQNLDRARNQLALLRSMIGTLDKDGLP
ncbi:MAG: aminoglycoside phosphotransferase [Acidimicrobiales bacterium]|nr:aminoglycoside phosphotransferase [Acidimicrobiales bacterium]